MPPRSAVIHKTLPTAGPTPYWTTEQRLQSDDVWAEARSAMQGLPGSGLNMAFEAADPHAQGALRNHVALRFVARDLPTAELTYGALARQTNHFANVLKRPEVGQGDRLLVLAGRLRELSVAVAPKEIAFLPTLPRTRSGKIMRRLLKARELGLPEGDTSTLESGA